MGLGLLLMAFGTPVISALTLEEAIREVREASPRAAIARERVAAARAAQREADALRLPAVMLDAGYLQTDQPMRAFGTILNTGRFSETIDFNRPGQVDHFHAAVTATLPLYHGGELTARRRAGRAETVTARADEAGVIAELELEVVRRYLGVIAAREAEAALGASVRAMRASAETAAARHEKGDLLRNEVLDLEVQLARTEDDRFAAAQAVRLAEQRLLILLDRDPDGAMEINPADAIPDWAVSPGHELTAAARPELRAWEARVEAADAAVEASRGSRLPKVEAFASFQYDRGWRLGGDGDSWIGGVRMQWPLFDGGRSDARTRLALARRSEAQAGARELDLAFRLQLEEARRAVELAERRLQTSERIVEQAAESAAIARLRFEAGDLLAAELLGAEARLTETRLRLALARTGVVEARASLRRAAGLPLID